MSNKIKLYFWNNYHNGDIITCKPLVWKLLDQYNNIEISWGCFKNHAYLLEDLPINIIIDPRNDDYPHDLSYLCPPDHTPIHLWLGQYPDTIPHGHQWYNQIVVFNRQCQQHNLNLRLVSNLTPMVSFPYKNISVKLNSIYIENGHTRSGHSDFYFDFNILTNLFPTTTFYCTAPPNIITENVIDCSNLNLVELSAISNKCDIIIGKGSGPLLCTYTEINRFKPRAVVGFKLNQGYVKFWSYENSPMQYLNTIDEVCNFINNNKN
jgi:hypothetical protein